MEKNQIIIYGLLVAIAMGVIQFLINQFILKKNALEKDKIDSILDHIEKIANSVEKMSCTINEMKLSNVATSTETHAKLEHIYKELERFDKRISHLEQVIKK